MSVFNIVITGIGGQGVVSLAQVYNQLADQHGWHCVSTVHKGGAQSLGTVSAELRLSPSAASTFSAHIPSGAVDLLIALEAWEALRTCHVYGMVKQAVIDNATMIAGLAEHVRNVDPVTALQQLPLSMLMQDFRNQALQQYGSYKMQNYLIGKAAVAFFPEALQDQGQYHSLFYAVVAKAVHSGAGAMT